MRLVVDAMCSHFGGIQTYVSNLLRTWPQEYPEDDLHVLLPADLPNTYPGVVEHRVRVPRPVELGRPLTQTREVRSLAARVQADAVLATLPSTTLIKPAVPVVVVVYDLRHELRPQQFSRLRRTMRLVSYGRGYRIADGIIAISQRSLDDLHRLHPKTFSTPGSVVHLGGDHVRSWPGVPTRNDAVVSTDTRAPAVAFGHQSNKNVDIVLEAWSDLVRQDPDGTPELLLLGASGATRQHVDDVRARSGLAGHLRVSPFLPDDQFAATMAAARLIVFPSDFEGFGLPVVEAMQLGIPIVIGPEPAVLEVAGGHATVMEDWGAPALADAVRSALGRPAESLDRAREHADHFTWARTTRLTRRALQDAINA